MLFVRHWRLWLALLAEAVLLMTLHQFDDWRYESMPVYFIRVAVFAGVAYLFAALLFSKTSPSRWVAITFWTASVGLRLLVLPVEPTDDLYRYQWEGLIQNAGYDPYLLPPNDETLGEVRARFPNWNQINHRDYTASYPPGTELLFAVLSRLRATAFGYKLLFAAADLGLIALLLRLIDGPRRYQVAAWYAWNPLAIYSFAGAAHFDSLLILGMLAGILFFRQANQSHNSSEQWKFALLGSVAFGMATSIRLVPILLLPLCAVALGWRVVSLVLSLMIPCGLSLFYGSPRTAIWQSLGNTYGTRVNDLFWWLIEETVWPNPHQKNFSYNAVIVVAALVVSLFFLRNWQRGLLWVLGTTLILTPVLHPWYCTWILPFAAWRRAHAWQVLGVSLFAYYLFWDERLFVLPWHSEPWLRAIICIPPILALLFSARLKWQPNEQRT